LACCVQPSIISWFVGGGQVMYRLAFTAVVIKWQNVATFLHMASRQVAKAILSFLGLIVQSAIIDE
jgi:hypothetical protein